MSKVERPELADEPESVLFAGPGEMRARCRAFDWASTPLGAVARWPQSLRTAVSLVLASGFPSVLHVGPEATFVYNDAWAELLDSAHRDALGHSSLETFAESRGAFEPYLRRALAGETVEPSEVTFPIAREDGSGGAVGTRWFTVSYAPLRDERGLVSGVVVTAVETTAARRATAALIEGETRLRLAVDVAELGTWEWDLVTGRGQIDQRGARIVGLAPGPLDDVMRAQLECIHPDDVGPLQARIAACIERGGAFDLEYRVIYPDRSVHHVASQARVLTDSAGTPVKLVGTNRDITTERVASAEREQLLTASEMERAAADLARRRLETVLEHLPVGVTLAEAPSGRLLVSNSAVRRIWGLDTPAARVADYNTLYVGFRPGTERQYANDEWPLARALTHGEIVTDEVIDIVRPDGTRRRLSISAAPVRDARGGTLGGVVLSIDVTERERLLAETEAARGAAEAARAEAEAASRAKSEFLAVMSHELRTPLNAIGGYAELMEMGIRGPVTVQQQEDLARIQTSQRHLLGLINEVLNYTKLETGMVRYAMSDVRARDAVAEAEGLIVPQARARGLGLAIVPCADTILVRADPEKLRQVLVNLLSNAVKFTDAGGRVEVLCESRDDVVRIHVSDTGIGIPPDRCEAIFEPFVQVRSDLTRTAEGTGLGLAISRDLARGMGGELTVESTLASGSTFTLTLARGGAG